MILYIMATGNPGGAERQGANIVHECRQRGADMRLVLVHGFGHMPGNLRFTVEERGTPCSTLEHIKDKTAAVLALCQQWQPQAVVGVGYPASLDVARAAKLAEVPIRVIRLESTGHVRRQFPQTRSAEQSGMQAATHYVGNSHAVLDSLDRYWGTSIRKGYVIPNGVTMPDLDEGVRQRARRHWGLKPNQLALGLLANLREDGLKNQVMAVRAMRRLIDKGHDAVLYLVGYTSPYEQTVRAEVERLGLQERVRIPGRIDNLDLLQGWDIALNTSRTEGLSNAVIECMAAGLPCVVTHVDGNIELAKLPGVFSVPDDDHATLADTLDQLAPDRQRYGYAAREAAQAHFNWDSITDQWLRLLGAHQGYARMEKV